MRESVVVLALLGGLIQIVAAVGGPQLAGVGMLTNEPAPPMPTESLLLGLSVAAVCILAGSFVAAGRNGQLWGLVMLAASVVGIVNVGPLTGWYTIGSFFTVLAGVLALFVRRPRRART